jgi:uncharacterized membrane protein YgcG
MTVVVSIACVIFAIIILIWVANRYHTARNGALTRRRAEYIRKYPFPVALRLKMRERFANLSGDQIDEIFDALRSWFLLLLAHRGTQFGMPSKAVDAAWHEFILMTRQYDAFCKEAFGEYLHHTPNDGSRDATQDGLARTFGASTLAGVGAGALVGTVAASQLFAIDQSLGIENGNAYSASELAQLHAMHDEAMRKARGDGGGGGCSGSLSVDGSGDRGSSMDGSSDGGSGGDGGGGGCGGGCGS